MLTMSDESRASGRIDSGPPPAACTAIDMAETRARDAHTRSVVVGPLRDLVLLKLTHPHPKVEKAVGPLYLWVGLLVRVARPAPWGSAVPNTHCISDSHNVCCLPHPRSIASLRERFRIFVPPWNAAAERWRTTPFGVAPLSIQDVQEQRPLFIAAPYDVS